MSEQLRAVYFRLKFLLDRGRVRFGPSGCLYCGRECIEAAVLCATCHDLFGRLQDRFHEIAPLPPTQPPPAYADLFTERMHETKGRSAFNANEHGDLERREWLPHPDD